MTLHHLMLFVHLAGVIVWVGGMSFAHFCLRPASLALPPPQRLALWHGVLARFFPIVWLALAAIVGSGFAMLLAVGFAQAPLAWHAMAAVGLVMAAIFASIWYCGIMKIWLGSIIWISTRPNSSFLQGNSSLAKA